MTRGRKFAGGPVRWAGAAGGPVRWAGAVGGPVRWAGACLGAALIACASSGPVTPPPALAPERLERVQALQPAVASEIELLEWRAREHAAQGDISSAERFARLARTLLESAEQVPASMRLCPDPAAAVDPSLGEAETALATASEEVDEEEPPPERKRRRRKGSKGRKGAGAAASAPSSTESLERQMQAFARALRQVDRGELNADGRVRLDAGQRALIEAQRAVAAGAPERARQHLEKVSDSLRAMDRDNLVGGSGLARTSTVSSLNSLEALAKDLERTNVKVNRSRGWLVTAMPKPGGGDPLTKRQQSRLQTLGRLLRVYGGARVCVGTTDAKPEEAERIREAVSNYLRDVEQLSASRFLPCARDLNTKASLFVGLTFSGWRRS